MIPYKNLSGNSGVRAFEIGKDFIDVVFHDGGVYRYTDRSAGIEAVDEMIKLAIEGRGLSAFISRVVKDRYEHGPS
jgi:hypothetical protein